MRNAIIDQAFPGDTPLPVICILPVEPAPELIAAFQRWRVLKGLKIDEIKKIGQDLHSSELAYTLDAISEALACIRGNNTFVMTAARSATAYAVPRAYRASVNGLSNPGLSSVLSTCYRLAYAYSPPEFYSQYKANKSALRSATRQVGTLLLRGSAASLMNASGVAGDICRKFLCPKWRILTPDYRVQEPGESHVRQAWDHLDRTFVAGGPEVMTRMAVVPLLNPPYGYDYNTATLLFCAWFGWRARDLKVSAQGRRVQLESMSVWLEYGSDKFIAQYLCGSENVALARAIPGDTTREVQALIKQVKMAVFTQDQAQSTIAKLLDYNRDEWQDAGLRSLAGQAADTLGEALQTATDYERQAQRTAQTLTAELDVEKLVNLRGNIEHLPRLGNVTACAPDAKELSQRLDQKLTQAVETACGRYENLQDRTQLALNQNNLERLRGILTRLGYVHLVQRVTEAGQTLQLRARLLENREQEAAIRDQIQSMDLSARLKTLYQYRDRLQSLIGLSPSLGQLRDQQLDKVSRRIDTLEQQVSNLVIRLEQVDSQDIIDSWRSQALRVQNLYNETDFQTKLADALDRGEQLRSFFAQLGRSQSLPLTRPQEAHDAGLEISRLADQYAVILGEPQRALIARAQGNLKAQTQKLRQTAISLLSELEQKVLTGTPPTQIKPKLDSPPAFLPAEEMPRWQALQVEVQEQMDRARLDQATREQIRTMDLNARLVTLYGYRDCLQAMNGLSGATLQLRDTQLAAMVKRIAVLERQTGELEAELTKVDSQGALESWRGRMLKVQSLYDETPYQSQLSLALTRSEQMRAFFTSLTRMQSARWSSLEEAQATEKLIAGLEQHYGDALGTPQRTLIANARRALGEQVQKARQAATSQLLELEQQARNGGTSLTQLKARLDSPPALLPDDDLPRWQALQSQVQEQLDRERMDQATREQIRAMDPGARLKVLYQYRAQLEAMSGLTKTTAGLRDKQLAAIAIRITVLENDVIETNNSLAKVQSQKVLDDWRGRVLKMQSQYDETPYSIQLDRVLAHAEQLRSYFADLGRVRSMRLSLNIPDDLREAEDGLMRIEESHGEILSELQRELVAQARPRPGDREREATPGGDHTTTQAGRRPEKRRLSGTAEGTTRYRPSLPAI